MKIDRKIKVGMAVMGILALQACATSADRKLDERVKSEPPVQNSEELSQRAKTTIEQDPSLSVEQKKKLNNLRESVSTELKGLRQQSLDLRALLLKDFEEHNDQEMSLIRNRLQKLYNQQVSLIFDSIKKANKIVGHTPSQRAWGKDIFIGERDHL